MTLQTRIESNADRQEISAAVASISCLETKSPEGNTEITFFVITKIIPQINIPTDREVGIYDIRLKLPRYCYLLLVRSAAPTTIKLIHD